jgi:hypothetical protein
MSICAITPDNICVGTCGRLDKIIDFSDFIERDCLLARTDVEQYAARAVDVVVAQQR